MRGVVKTEPMDRAPTLLFGDAAKEEPGNLPLDTTISELWMASGGDLVLFNDLCMDLARKDSHVSTCSTLTADTLPLPGLHSFDSSPDTVVRSLYGEATVASGADGALAVSAADGAIGADGAGVAIGAEGASGVAGATDTDAPGATAPGAAAPRVAAPAVGAPGDAPGDAPGAVAPGTDAPCTAGGGADAPVADAPRVVAPADAPTGADAPGTDALGAAGWGAAGYTVFEDTCHDGCTGSSSTGMVAQESDDEECGTDLDGELMSLEDELGAVMLEQDEATAGTHAGGAHLGTEAPGSHADDAAATLRDPCPEAAVPVAESALSLANALGVDLNVLLHHLSTLASNVPAPTGVGNCGVPLAPLELASSPVHAATGASQPLQPAPMPVCTGALPPGPTQPAPKPAHAATGASPTMPTQPAPMPRHATGASPAVLMQPAPRLERAAMRASPPAAAPVPLPAAKPASPHPVTPLARRAAPVSPALVPQRSAALTAEPCSGSASSADLTVPRPAAGVAGLCLTPSPCPLLRAGTSDSVMLALKSMPAGPGLRRSVTDASLCDSELEMDLQQDGSDGACNRKAHAQYMRFWRSVSSNTRNTPDVVLTRVSEMRTDKRTAFRAKLTGLYEDWIQAKEKWPGPWCLLHASMLDRTLSVFCCLDCVGVCLPISVAVVHCFVHVMQSGRRHPWSST